MSEWSLSILIPVYNAGEVLRETLRSALTEARSVGAEVIALDDGSNDGSADVLAEFRDAGLRYQRQVNQGVSAARNTLARLASGEWLLFLDADDLLLPGTLHNRRSALLSMAVDALYCDWCRFRDDAGQRIWGEQITRRIEDVHADPAIALFAGFWSPPGAWVFRRSLHQAIGGFRADLPVIQDARYALDAALTGAHLGHSAHIGFAYREGQEGSLSRRSATRFASDCLLHASQIEAIYRERGYRDALVREALRSTYEYAARELATAEPAAASAALRAAWLHRGPTPSRWLRSAHLATSLLGSRAGLAIVTAAGRALHGSRP